METEKRPDPILALSNILQVGKILQCPAKTRGIGKTELPVGKEMVAKLIEIRLIKNVRVRHFFDCELGWVLVHMRSYVNPSSYVRGWIVNESADGQTMPAPVTKVLFVGWQNESAIANIRRAGFYLRSDAASGS